MNWFSIALIWFGVEYAGRTNCLNHGRDARPGEFPFILRIAVFEQDDDYNATANRSNDSKIIGAVSTGVLITTQRVLTTCGSVGFFTGEFINLYDLSKVRITGGSVLKSGEGGETQQPTGSSSHPYCYALTTTKVVIFNYGIYLVGTPFGSTLDRKLLSPIPHYYKNSVEMETVLRSMYEQRLTLRCFAAGWGNQKKQFEGKGMPDHFVRFSPTLQTTEVTIVRYSLCYEKTCDFFKECVLLIWEYGFVCAQALQGGPCNEDHGAPLVCDGEVFAIQSYTLRCANSGVPRHFLRLDLAYDYIFDVKSRSSRCYALLNRLGIFIVMLCYLHSANFIRID